MLVEERAITILAKYPRLMNPMHLKRGADFMLLDGQPQKAVIEVVRWIENAEIEGIDIEDDITLYSYLNDVLAKQSYEEVDIEVNM